MSVDLQFTGLYEKLQQLLRQYNRLEKENEKLKEELEASKQAEVDTQNKIEELQQQIAILKLAAGEMSEKDKKVFDKKLGQYVKEIDRTIAYLSE